MASLFKPHPTPHPTPVWKSVMRSGVDKIDITQAIKNAGGSWTYQIENDPAHNLTKLLVNFGYENNGHTANFEIDFTGQNAFAFSDLKFA